MGRSRGGRLQVGLGAIFLACHQGPPRIAGPDDVDTWPFECILMDGAPHPGDRTSSCEMRPSLHIERAGRAFTARRHEGVSGVMPACDSGAHEGDLAGAFEGGVLRLSGTLTRSPCTPGVPPGPSPVTYVLRYDEDTDSFSGTRNDVPIWCAHLSTSKEPCAMPE